MTSKAFLKFLLAAMLLQACNPTPADGTNSATGEPGLTSPAGDMATPRPTPGPTDTVWPPVFDFWSLGDIRELDSFVVTVDEKNTVNGRLTERTITAGYIQEPYAAYRLIEYSGGVDRTYIVNGRTYALTGSGDWYITAGTNADVYFESDISAGNPGKLMEAQFAGEEEYQGIAAYHFVLDSGDSSQSSANYQIEGDLYLAKDGNYLLYSHWKETSTQGDFVQNFEVTQALSSINQLTEFTLPANMQDMVSAADLPTELALPLPADSKLSSMIRYKSGIGVDVYYFSAPKTSIDEFLDFYRNLPPTDGWTVSHVGHVSLHEDDCEFSRECVIINKGSTQVVLYYNGATIRAEFDWPHLYSPL